LGRSQLQPQRWGRFFAAREMKRPPTEAALGAMMSTAMKGRLIGLVVIELVICTMWLFGTANPAVFAVVTIGVPVAPLLVALPISLLLRSKRSSDPN
jgi:hypothetical protein